MGERTKLRGEDVPPRELAPDPFLPPDERVSEQGPRLSADPFMPPEQEVAAARALSEHHPDIFAPPKHAMPAEEELPTLEVEAKGERTRNATAQRMLDEPKPRAGCSCKKRYDVYLDDDFGGLAKWLGGGIGIGTIILGRWVGVLGVLALMFGMAAMGGFATVLSITMRCEGCRHRVTDLDSLERDDVRIGRRRVTLVTLGLAAVAVVSAAIWVWTYRAPMIPVEL